MENQNINQNQNVEKKENDFRNIMLTIVGVFIILAAVSGGTYAYYAYSATNNTTISGTGATANLELTVTKISPSTTSPLVPQLEAGIKTAANSLCKDGNNNNVCHVYSITVTNKSTATAVVRGSITFPNIKTSVPTTSQTSPVYVNLKWATFNANPSSNTAVTKGTTKSASATDSNKNNLVQQETLAVNASKTYYVVVWINETSASQNNTDRGTFIGQVEFTDSSGKGLTSTFTS